MDFRPCIDIHNGKIKQIVGASLKDEKNQADENFVSDMDGAFYADFYKSRNIRGGHIILLNAPDSEFFEASKEQAILALKTFPGGLQIGGGVNPENAGEYIRAGASHVIVTSYVFKNGIIDFDNLDKMVATVGKEHLVLDLSCRKKNGQYYIVTDRWQKFTNTSLTISEMEKLSDYCDEFLIHAVDVEGKASGIEEELAEMLGEFTRIPVTYAGGVHNYEDLKKLKILGKNHVNVTIGSALDLFGGNMVFAEVLRYVENVAE